MLISDHINLTADSPLEGATFIDLTDLYSPRLRDLAREVDPSLDEGVYAQFRGPHYETPAEVQMAKAIGGHIVGMSTALEAIAARQAGMEVLGISLVTNLAAGICRQPLSHAEVLEAGREAEPRISALRLASSIVDGHCDARAAGTTDDRASRPQRQSWRAQDPDGDPDPTELGGARGARRAGRADDPAPASTLRVSTRGSHFGTAGLRGELGAGPEPDEPGAGAQAAAGFAAFLLTQCERPPTRRAS